MSLQNKIFAGFAENTGKNKIKIDSDAFVRRILLFDEYIVRTIRLADIAQLTRNFGVNGLIALLETGIVRIHCDALTMAQTGQSILYDRDGKKILPLGSYSFHNINVSDRKQYISDCLANIHTYVPNLKEAIKLKKAVLQAITSSKSNNSVYMGFSEALEQNRNIVKAALKQTLPDFGYRNVDSAKLSIKITKISNNDYQSSTNLTKLINISPKECHEIVGRSLLSVSGFYQRLGYMRNYSALAWFHENDLSLLDAELSLFDIEADSNRQEHRYTRILDLKGLPQIDNEQKIDVGKILKLRESPECRDFREWLRASDSLSDKDIEEAINSYRVKVSSVLGGRIGKIIRFVVSGGAGAAVTPVAGLAIDAVDEFVLNSIIKKPGPVSFINNSLPKLYKN